MKELADIIRLWEQRRGQPFALATLVRARGSSYRRPGARMLVAHDGVCIGALSGGCLEEEVAAQALEVIRTGKPTLMEFDTRRRFGCSGSIQIFVERVQDSFLAELAAHLQARRNCSAVTVFLAKPIGTQMLPAHTEAPADAFVQQIEPAIQLIIFGEGPDSAPLRSIARTLGWHVIETERAADLPDQADARTAAIVKSHNYGRDFAALQRLLPLRLRYVGLLGPRKRRDQLLADLLDGHTALESDLFAPAGFDLRAETPEEIALAIVSEIQAVFAEGSGQPLRDRKAPIHGWNVASRAPACTALPR